jgi:hypothetical protein
MTQATSRGMFSGVRRRAHIVDLGPRVDHAGVDQHAARGVVDCPDEYGPLFAVHDDVRCEVGVDHAPTLTAGAARALYGGARPHGGPSGRLVSAKAP